MVEGSSEAEALSRTLGALSDPTRRAIVHQLREGSATVGEIARPFDISLHAVSKHVRVLERAGLLHREIRGREHHLHLSGAPLRDVAEWVQGYAGFWEGRLDALERHLTRTKHDD